MTATMTTTADPVVVETLAEKFARQRVEQEIRERAGRLIAIGADPDDARWVVAGRLSGEIPYFTAGRVQATFCEPVNDNRVDAMRAATELDEGQFRSYLEHRRGGFDADAAFVLAANEHHHRYEISVTDTRDKVLRTGVVITTRRCACGDQLPDEREVHNWSGD